MVTFTGKLKLDITQVNFLGKQILQTLLMDHKLQRFGALHISFHWHFEDTKNNLSIP